MIHYRREREPEPLPEFGSVSVPGSVFVPESESVSVPGPGSEPESEMLSFTIVDGPLSP
jgi:hypothetical protein